MGFEKAMQKAQGTEQTTVSEPQIKGYSPILKLIKKYYDDVVISLFAESQSGKTLLLLQEAFRISHEQKKPFLYIDTEGGGKHFIEDWREKFMAMYPDASFKIIRLPSLKETMKFVGKLVKINNTADKMKKEETKENMKANPKITVGVLDDFVDDVDRCELFKICSRLPKDVSERGECGVSCIIFDSITTCLDHFPADQQNFGARSNVATYIFEGLNSMAARYDKLVTFAISHSSKNPAMKFDKAKMVGGKAVQHRSKIVFRLVAYSGKNTAHMRKLILSRMFSVPPDTLMEYCKLGNNGFYPISREEFESKTSKDV